MTAADIDRVIEIAASLPDAPHWPRSAYVKALNPEATPHRVALVASQTPGGAIDGLVVASVLPPRAELETIAVSPACQRKGLGRLLFDALAGELRTAGVRELLLEVRVSNLPALAFYRTAGFVQTSQRQAYYVDPVEDAVVMQLRLV